MPDLLTPHEWDDPGIRGRRWRRDVVSARPGEDRGGPVDEAGLNLIGRLVADLKAGGWTVVASKAVACRPGIPHAPCPDLELLVVISRKG